MADTQTESLYNYNISLKIKGEDYTTSLENIRIVSSLTTKFQGIEIYMMIDTNDVVLNSISGQDPITLEINMKNEADLIPDENVKMELMYLSSDASMPIKSTMSETKHIIRTPYTLHTVPRKPYKAMTSEVWGKFSGKTPTEIVESLVSTFSDCELILDNQDKNTNRYEQVLIPQGLNIYDAIKYLDDRFGLYNGASNLGFCQYDNKFTVMNLSKRMNKSQTITITHLSDDTADADDIIKQSSDGKNFYTTTPLKCDYRGNVVFAELGSASKVCVKSATNIFDIIEWDTKEICSQFGAVFNNDEMFIDDNLKRTQYVSEDAGTASGEVSVSWIARQIIGLATVELEIGKSLPILNLINVGEPVKLKTKTEAYKKLEGKYLLLASLFTFKKETAGWLSNCTLRLMRTNKES